MKYREFWIKRFSNTMFFGSCVEQEAPGGDHVIEFAAYEKMKADRDTLLADYLALKAEYDNANKMLEEMAEALKDHIRLSQGIIPLAYEKRAYAILDKYRAWLEGMK